MELSKSTSGQIQDGGRQPNFKRSNRYNSAADRPVLLKFGRVLYLSLDLDTQLVEKD